MLLLAIIFPFILPFLPSKRGGHKMIDFEYFEYFDSVLFNAYFVVPFFLLCILVNMVYLKEKIFPIQTELNEVRKKIKTLEDSEN